MSGIINPQTGLPNGFMEMQQAMHQQVQSLTNALQVINRKVDSISQQQIHMGMFTEYIQLLLEENEVVTVDADAFQAWAEKRWVEIQAEAEAFIKEQQGKSVVEAAEEMGVKLEE